MSKNKIVFHKIFATILKINRSFPIFFNQLPCFENRTRQINLIIMSTALCLVARYAYLSVFPNQLRDNLRLKSNNQISSNIVLQSPRAPILDRNGNPLAVSALRTSYFIIPSKFPTDVKVHKEISKKFLISPSKLTSLASSKKDFAWIKRKVTEEEKSKIGPISRFATFLGEIEEPTRWYPEGSLASHLIGYVGSNNQGLEGVERLFNDALVSSVSKIKVSRDARRKLALLSPNEIMTSAFTPEPLRLTIDKNIQKIAENTIKKATNNARATAGSIVVVDIESSEILAIASTPDFNINDFSSSTENQRRFRAIQDGMELGSVLKPFLIGYALDKGAVTLQEKINCENGTLRISGGNIHDDHPRAFLTTEEIIKYSSNICTYKIAQRLGRKRFSEFLELAGFTRQPGTGLLGEWSTKLHPHNKWSEMRFANMSFGQGISISPLQITKALVTLVSGGIENKLQINLPDDKKELNGPKIRFISNQTSKIVTQMMTSVVESEGGTGSKAALSSLNIAGKTGTAQKFVYELKSYSERIASFIGVFPAESPKFAVTVVIDEPKVRPAYGGLLAGPAFAEVAQGILDYYGSLGQIEILSSQPNTKQLSKSGTSPNEL